MGRGFLTVAVAGEDWVMMSKLEYRPCPHCGHQVKVRRYVRRFGVPSLPKSFLPSHNCRLRGCLECDPKEGHPATGCVAAPARKFPVNK